MEYLLILTLLLLIGAVFWYKRGELNPDTKKEQESVARRAKSFLQRGITGKLDENEVPYNGIPNMPQVVNKPKDPDVTPPEPTLTGAPVVSMHLEEPTNSESSSDKP